MDFETFTRRAEEILAGVPPEFLTDVVGVEAHRAEKRHPHLPEVFTLGECGADEVSRMTDPETIRSRIHLYHGSFAALARKDPEFDFEGELKETVLHELRHHLEDRAGILDLLREDAMEDALARWQAGEEMPDDWYRAGEEMEEDVFRVGDDLFVELRLREEDFRELLGTTAELTVLDEPLFAEIPDDLSPDETLSFEGEGLERSGGGGSGELHLIFMLR
ncbi:MAG: metallopeptidase family protein [Planctomycetes bacterium]|jgi:hypothetical protein|nr:metallopeptidase family protein [Planctomycetota bacterium]